MNFSGYFVPSAAIRDLGLIPLREKYAHVTMQYDSRAKPSKLVKDITPYAVWEGNEGKALVVLVDGEAVRNDWILYHITLQVNPDYKAVEVGRAIDLNNVKALSGDKLDIPGVYVPNMPANKLHNFESSGRMVFDIDGTTSLSEGYQANAISPLTDLGNAIQFWHQKYGEQLIFKTNRKLKSDIIIIPFLECVENRYGSPAVAVTDPGVVNGPITIILDPRDRVYNERAKNSEKRRALSTLSRDGYVVFFDDHNDPGYHERFHAIRAISVRGEMWYTGIDFDRLGNIKVIYPTMYLPNVMTLVDKKLIIVGPSGCGKTQLLNELKKAGHKAVERDDFPPGKSGHISFQLSLCRARVMATTKLWWPEGWVRENTNVLVFTSEDVETAAIVCSSYVRYRKNHPLKPDIPMDKPLTVEEARGVTDMSSFTAGGKNLVKKAISCMNNVPDYAYSAYYLAPKITWYHPLLHKPIPGIHTGRVASRKEIIAGRTFTLYKYIQGADFGEVDNNAPGVLSSMKEMRGIIVDSQTFAIACRPFKKFFNYGEKYHDAPTVAEWANGVTLWDKIDGSLIKLWCYNQEWRISTNGGINADNILTPDGTPFGHLVRALWTSVDLTLLNKFSTHMFELVGPKNRVVINYEPKLYYLGSRRNVDGEEYLERSILGMLPKSYIVHSLDQCYTMIQKLNPGNTVTHEGYVLSWKRGSETLRVKFKEEKYVKLHYYAGGDTKKLVAKAIHKGESEEIKVYFPELFEEINNTRRDIIVSLSQLRHQFHKQCSNKKEYMECVKEANINKAAKSLLASSVRGDYQMTSLADVIDRYTFDKFWNLLNHV